MGSRFNQAVFILVSIHSAVVQCSRYRKRRDSSRHSESSEESDKENDKKKAPKRKKAPRKKPSAVPATAQVRALRFCVRAQSRDSCAVLRPFDLGFRVPFHGALVKKNNLTQGTRFEKKLKIFPPK